jgi:hypothetical protein
MTQPIYRDKSIRMTEATMASLKLLGWDFYMTGPNEWQWIRFNAAGRTVAVQGDEYWSNDLKLIEAVRLRKLVLRDEE